MVFVLALHSKGQLDEALKVALQAMLRHLNSPDVERYRPVLENYIKEIGKEQEHYEESGTDSNRDSSMNTNKVNLPEGIGKKLVLLAVEAAREAGLRTIELGTGNSSVGQLRVYQKCGFRIVGVDIDFFIRHYDQPIFENGIECRDMIRLKQDL